MPKTLVDIDERLLAEAMELLGTGTKKDTVNAALAEVVRIRRVREAMDFFASGALDDWHDPAVRASACR